jgi:hypothetical protein
VLMEYDETQASQGELPAVIGPEHIVDGFRKEFADQAGGAGEGFEPFTVISDTDGRKIPLTAENHSLEPAEEEAHRWLKLKEAFHDHKTGIAVTATVVTVGAIYKATKYMRERKK